jgi:hypothetical protein
MIAFSDDHRGAHGVEPICKVLPIAPAKDLRIRRKGTLKPDLQTTAPPDNYAAIGVADAEGRSLTVSPDADSAIIRSGTGGLY